MTDTRKYVQGIKYRLYGSGIGSSDTSIRLTSMTLPNSGELVTMTMFGDKGYATIEPGNRTREENISFTGITQNVDGSATLTGVTRGLKMVDPYDQDLTLRKSHAGGVVISVTNSAPFYSDLANKYNDETIVGKYTFPSTAGVDRPVISADTNAVLTEELITKGELNRAITATFLTPTIINTSSATTGTSTAGSLTWSHVSSGDNRLLLVQISTEEDKTITGVTYNGDALIQAASHTRVTGDLRTEIWYRIAPDLGTNNIVVTASAAAYISATALTINSAHQTTPIGIVGDADGSSTTPSVSVVTTQVNSLIVDSLATANDPTTFTAGANQSIQQSIEDTATRQIATSVEGTTAVGSYTMNYTIDPTGNWAITAVEIKGIAGGGGGGSDNFTVKATALDTTPNYLDDKISLTSTDGSVTITKTINNPAANEDIEYDLSVLLSGGGGTKIAIDTTASTVTGGMAPTTVYSIPIPGGTLGTNDAIRFKVLLSTLNVDNTEETRFSVEYGGTQIGIAILGGTDNVDTTDGWLEGVIVADGATNAQKGFISAITYAEPPDAATTIATGYGTGAVDSTISQNLDIIIESPNGVSSVTAEAIVVEKITDGSGASEKKVGVGEYPDTQWYNYQAQFVDIMGASSAWTLVNFTPTLTGIVTTGASSAQLTPIGYFSGVPGQELQFDSNKKIIVQGQIGFSASVTGKSGWGFNDIRTTQGVNAGPAIGFCSDNAGNWYTHVGDGGLNFTENAITAIDDGVMHTLRIEYNPVTPNCLFYVDGVLVDTISSATSFLSDPTVLYFETGEQTSAELKIVTAPSFAIEI